MRISRFRSIYYYIDFLTPGIDSAGNFTSILCVRYFFSFFTYLDIIAIKSVVNVNFSKKPGFGVEAGLNSMPMGQFHMESYFFKLNLYSMGWPIFSFQLGK